MYGFPAISSRKSDLHFILVYCKKLAFALKTDDAYI
jgi:hypothetical protein